MAEREPTSATVVTAGILILLLTGLFAVIGVDLARQAFDASSIDRDTYLTAIGLGLTREETQTLKGMLAALVLGLCVLTTVIGVGVLARREGVRHAAIGTFVAFALITIPIAVTGILSEDPAGGAVVGLAIGVVDAAIVVLMLRPETTTAFERAERSRLTARSARRTARAARRR